MLKGRARGALNRAVASVVRISNYHFAASGMRPRLPRGDWIEQLEPRTMLSRALGIDVSNYQGTINWATVHSAGKSFAFAKATEGASFLDSTLADNMTHGTAAGMLMGAYHFARPDSSANDAVNEANWFLSNAKQYVTRGYLRPILDVEDGSALGKSALSQWVNTFCATVQNATGIDPIIYCNTDYATNDLDSTATSHKLWIANWSTSYGDPTTTGSPPTGVWGGNWDFWQYSDSGSVSGISGNVDLDAYAGDLTSLQSNFVINGTIVYRNDFEGGAGPEWSKNLTETPPAPDPQREGSFLGRFSGGNNGWLRGTASWVAGRTDRGTAIHLDGSSGYLEVPYDETLQFGEAATVSAWVRFNAVPSNDVIAENVPAVGSGPSGGFMLGIENGQLYFEVRDAAGNTYNNKTASGGVSSFATGVWYHLTGTYANGTIKTYVGTFTGGAADDALDRQSAPGGIMAQGTRMLIGRRKGTGSPYLAADIDDVQIYSTALQLPDIQQLPNGTRTSLVDE